MLNRYLSVQDAAEKYEKTVNTFYTMASKELEKSGSYPAWYVKNGTSFLIDCKVYERAGMINKKAWNYNTSYLYWIFTDHLSMSENWLAVKMSECSSVFNNHRSWVTFLNVSMWQLPDERLVTERYSYMIDFILNGTKLAYLIKKVQDNGKINYLKKDEALAEVMIGTRKWTIPLSVISDLESKFKKDNG